jgi:hypothetical protein
VFDFILFLSFALFMFFKPGHLEGANSGFALVQPTPAIARNPCAICIRLDVPNDDATAVLITEITPSIARLCRTGRCEIRSLKHTFWRRNFPGKNGRDRIMSRHDRGMSRADRVNSPTKFECRAPTL